jgi:tRNA(Ile)-lysidine synthase
MRQRSPQGRTLERRIAANLRRRCGVRRGDRLVVAVSGGSDSVALLHLLVDVARPLDLGLEVAHFDHALRTDSAADAAWVIELSRTLGLTSHVERWDAPRPGEAAARAARYAFLDRIARARSADAIVVAHHLDDQIETFLLRLGRGSGPRGALGMPWRRTGPVPIVRPLLDVRRAQLQELCAARGIAWREDPTNTQRDKARNRVRQDVLPELETALGPRWMEHWGATIDDWRSIWQWIDSQATALLDSAAATKPNAYQAETLRHAPKPVLRAALLRWLDRAQPQRAHIDAAARLVQTGKSGRVILLPNGYRLARDQACLELLTPTNVGLQPPQATLHAEPIDGATARAALEQPAIGVTLTATLDVAPAQATAVLAADALQPPLELRTPRPGDRVQLLGSPGRRTVARLLQDHRVPRRARATWPVVVDGAGIVWLPGIGVAERARIQPGTSAAWRASYLRTAARPAPPGRGREATPPSEVVRVARPGPVD